MLPALFAGGAVALIARSDRHHPGVPHPQPVSKLARLAERAEPRLAPLDARRGRAALGPLPLEQVDGGIRPAEPSRISIPAAKINAHVRPVKARKGVIEIPPIGVAGWYSGGPRPGEDGRSVIIGHLDTHKGLGLFAKVPSLPPGTEIAVTDRRGDEHDYRVVGLAQVHKNRFPASAVYGPAEKPVLVLITCGGEFIPGKGYRDNVLLYARAA